MTSFGTSLGGVGGGSFGVPIAAGITGILAKTLADATLSAAGTVATEGGTDLYPLYTPLDRNTIFFHADAGPWGDAYPLVAPALPTTTRSVTVHSKAEFETASAVAGSEITVATGWDPTTTAAILSSDCDIVIPSGIAIGGLQIGSFSARTIRRTRIRGTTPGTHSGGRCGQLRDYIQIISSGTIIEDVIVDGVDINGDGNFGGAAEENQAFRLGATRICIMHCRAIAGGYVLIGNAQHVLIADCNFYHGAASRSVMSYPEGWGIRAGAGPIVVVDSRIQGTRYHNFRVNSYGNAGELAYVARTKLVNVAEGRTAWLWNNLNNAPLGSGQGAVIENCDIYTYTQGGCGLGSDLSANSCDYSRIRNCNFFGGGSATYSQSSLNAQAGSQTGDHDWSVGNTFTAIDDIGDLPAWGGPGDPTAVPLPSGMTLITGDSPCGSL